MRFVYAMFKTREQADDFLYDMWATGEVGTLEKPRIEKRGAHYALTLLCE